MLTDVAGVRVGHWTDEVGRTGVTVVLLPEGTVASGEVRGGAPATREFELLDPRRMMRRLDAVVLCGGSAFGLAAADGVMRFLEERGVGFPTRVGPVPIVVGLGLFDLPVGDHRARPDATAGEAACVAAGDGAFERGAVGAGTGARLGLARDRPAGVGTATERWGDVIVSALVVVNALGGLVADGPADLDAVASLFDPDGRHGPADGADGHTVVGVVVTNATLDKVGCRLVAEGAHDGLARAIDPPHTSGDGDAIVAAATGAVACPLDVARALAVRAVEAAIVDAVTHGRAGAG